MLTTAITIAMFLLGLAIALNLWRLVIGPSLPDRILALDTMYINAIPLLVLLLVLLMSMMAGRIFLGFGSWESVAEYLKHSR